jgi:hypothetical protein
MIKISDDWTRMLFTWTMGKITKKKPLTYMISNICYFYGVWVVLIMIEVRVLDALRKLFVKGQNFNIWKSFILQRNIFRVDAPCQSEDLH